jgi:cell fate regulator YaaT (PSP1 superfamily)
MSENNNAVDPQKEQESPSIHTVVGIRFRCCGKVYNFELNGLDTEPGMQVVVESEMGMNIGRVVTKKQTIEEPEKALKKVLRIATEEDLEQRKENKALEEEAKAFCTEKAGELNLDLKVVATEISLDKKRFIFYFTADGRIDFRGLVRDLAARFKTRIEMRQIGVRDEVKLLGGIGPCGRQTCCSSFLSSFEPITIRMAKEQDLSINQSKLSGICGRLMCCLGYEVRDSDEEEEVVTLKSALEQIEEVTEMPGEEISGISAGKEEPADISISESSDRTKIETPSPAPEKEKRKPVRHKRRRRRFRKPRGEKPAGEKPPVQATPQKQEKKEGQEKAEKGKPFSKRRRFRKKKRPSQ